MISRTISPHFHHKSLRLLTFMMEEPFARHLRSLKYLKALYVQHGVLCNVIFSPDEKGEQKLEHSDPCQWEKYY